MAYNYPKGASIVVSARLAVAASNAALSAVTFNNLDFGSAYMQGSAPYTGFICPAVGVFEFVISGWACGGGNGAILVTSKRGVSTVYSQSWVSAVNTGDCQVFEGGFIIPNCQVGDVVTFQANENNTAGAVTSITDPTSQGQGRLKVFYWPQYS